MPTTLLVERSGILNVFGEKQETMLFDILLSSFIGFFSAEVIVRGIYAKVHTRLLSILPRITKAIKRSNTSDDRKQQFLLTCSARLMLYTLQIFAYFVVWSVGLIVISLLFSLFDQDIWQSLASWNVILLSSLIACVYGHFRYVAYESQYGLFSRTLHWSVLANPVVGEISFDLDKSFFFASVDKNEFEPPLFVSGLARAGTTILMRSLYATDVFRSLTYDDMPFVMAPRMWNKCKPHKDNAHPDKQRPHGDGVRVNPKSPEAFEEVFWRVFVGREYIKKDRLIPVAIDDKVIENFRTYVKAVMEAQNHPRRMRYLSKNNNNVLRLDAISKAFPQATILIPFRDPLQQAMSLQRQHGIFTRLHQADPFSMHYMTWLGHHEFGANHLRFQFMPTECKYLPADGLNYWLEIWHDTYKWLIEHPQPNAFFINYDSLCINAEAVLEKLCHDINIPSHKNHDTIAAPRSYVVSDAFDADLYKDSFSLHKILVHSAKY